MCTWKEIKKQFYKTNVFSQSLFGNIDFNPDNMKNVKNGNFKSYDEYLEVQKRSHGKIRDNFETCYYSMVDYKFSGKIEFFTPAKNKVIFTRIAIKGMMSDGDMFEGKEDHIWMDMEPFKEFSPGDNLRFSADIERYMKRKNGKLIDYELSNPRMIEKIESYKIPTDDELLRQQIKMIICETCVYHDQCYQVFCLMDQNVINGRIEMMMKAARSSNLAPNSK